MAVSFNEQAFEQKLQNLKDTQEAINALSTWCLQNKEHHKKIVTCWLHCLKRVKIDVRLSLFYLANDVIQYSKRKHYDFVESWATALQKATPLVRDDKVRHRIQRIFKIWEERGVYDEAFISDLCGLLTSSVKKKEKAEIVEQSDPNDFQPNLLVRRMKEIKVLEENTDIKFKRIQDNKLPLTDADSLRVTLKERRHGTDVAAEVDSGVKKMEAFVKALESEISTREKLIDLLRQATLFYETQRGEAKIVANAYKNFGNRLKVRQKAIEEVMSTLLSPLPSPDINAPSPSPDSELELPEKIGEAIPTTNGAPIDFNFVNSSFIGLSQFADISKDVFGDSMTSEAQPIEVIGGRETSTNFVNEFFKSLKEAAIPEQLPAPPVPPAFESWAASGLWDQPPPETPQSPPVYEKQQQSYVQPVEYDDSHPLPVVPDVDQRSLLPVITTPQNLPPLDMDHRVPPPSLPMCPPPMNVPPPDLTGPPPPPPILMNMNPTGELDMDQRTLGNNIVSERAALIPPPTPGLMLAPPPPMTEFFDVDQRNLIQLTGRNAKAQWNSSRGPEERKEGDPRVKDIVESIDMDVSEDDEDNHHNRNNTNNNMGKRPQEHVDFTEDVSDANMFEPPDTNVPVYCGPSDPPPMPPNPPQENTNDHIPNDRLSAMHNAGAKLIPHEEPEEEYDEEYDENGYEWEEEQQPHLPQYRGFRRGGHFEPRPRWQSPRPRGPRPHGNFPYQPPSPFRGGFRARPWPRFRPRGRW